MKRMNVMVEEEILSEVKKLLNTDSFSSTINKALEETLQRLRREKFTKYFGSGIWEGDLAEMRDEKRSTRKKTKSGKSK